MKMDALAKRLDAFVVSLSINAASTYTVDSCSICMSLMHLAQNCPYALVFFEYPMEQANTFNEYRKQSARPYSKTYNPGWRNHLNYLWKQNQRGAPQNAKTHYPPRFQAQQHNQPTSQVPASLPQSALEETMRMFIKSNGQLMQKLQKSTMINSQAIQEVKNVTMVNTQAIGKIENQIGQITNHLGERENGKFPSQPEPNPKAFAIGNSQHVQAIVTLRSVRSGRQVDNHVVDPEVDTTGQEGEASGNKGKRVATRRKEMLSHLQPPSS